VSRGGVARREFLRFLAGSPLLMGPPLLAGCRSPSSGPRGPASSAAARNVFDLEAAARRELPPGAFEFLADGADDLVTLEANRIALRRLQIRARRLVDVSRVDTSLSLLGQPLSTPILLAPIGLQEVLHPEGELASVRGAAAGGHLPIVSSVSSFSVAEIRAATPQPIWFQLYPTPERRITRGLLARAERARCSAVVLTVDTPVIGNRENHIDFLRGVLEQGRGRMGNYEGLRTDEPLPDPGLTFDFLGWLRKHTALPLLVKGIVTHEDARRCVQEKVDGIVVSNHGGRQEESGRGTTDCLPEVVEAVQGACPVLIDGGFRRGTDVFKALALGATAVCVGRPYAWGLAAFGQQGVERALEILRAELIRIMQLAGTPSLSAITRSHVKAA